jgi:hypothetical protein
MADFSDYDPNRFLIDWTPPQSGRAIDCECGREVQLQPRGNAVCEVCGRVWNAFGRLVATVWPTRRQE